MSDHNANQYPEFNAQSVADGYWEVYHDDDCGEAFDWFGGAVCPKCGFRPDMQSIAARKTVGNIDNHEPLKAVSPWHCLYTEPELMEAYADHRAAALQAELRVAIEDGDADFWKARAESAESSLLSSKEEIEKLKYDLRDRDEQIKYASAGLGGNPAIHLHDRIYHLKQAAESSAALVRELAQNFELLYSRIGTADLKMSFCLSPDKFEAIVRAHCKAESLLSDPAVKKVLEK